MPALPGQRPSRPAAIKKLARRRARKERYKPSNLLRRFLLLVIFLLALGSAFKIFPSWQNRLWKEEGRFTVVVATEDPRIFSFNPQSGRLTIITIPARTELEASHGYGSFFAGSLWELGQQEGLGGEILANSIKKNFGIPVDAWTSGAGEVFFTPRVLALPVALKEGMVSAGLETNLTFFDRVALLMRAAATSTFARQEIDLKSSRVIQKITLPDGAQAYKVIPEQAKVAFEKAFRDERVFQEAKTVSIVNTSGKTGLGADVARLLAVLGTRVISVRDGEREVSGCLVSAGREALGTSSVKRISQLLGCSVSEGDGEVIEVFLGEGFAKKF